MPEPLFHKKADAVMCHIEDTLTGLEDVVDESVFDISYAVSKSYFRNFRKICAESVRVLWLNFFEPLPWTPFN